MRYCMFCGEEMPDKAIFCPSCGAKQPQLEPKEEVKQEEENDEEDNIALSILNKANFVSTATRKESIIPQTPKKEKNVSRVTKHEEPKKKEPEETLIAKEIKTYVPKHEEKTEIPKDEDIEPQQEETTEESADDGDEFIMPVLIIDDDVEEINNNEIEKGSVFEELKQFELEAADNTPDIIKDYKKDIEEKGAEETMHAATEKEEIELIPEKAKKPDKIVIPVPEEEPEEEPASKQEPLQVKKETAPRTPLKPLSKKTQEPKEKVKEEQKTEEEEQTEEKETAPTRKPLNPLSKKKQKEETEEKAEETTSRPKRRPREEAVEKAEEELTVKPRRRPRSEKPDEQASNKSSDGKEKTQRQKPFYKKRNLSEEDESDEEIIHHTSIKKNSSLNYNEINDDLTADEKADIEKYKNYKAEEDDDLEEETTPTGRVRGEGRKSNGRKKEGRKDVDKEIAKRKVSKIEHEEVSKKEDKDIDPDYDGYYENVKPIDFDKMRDNSALIKTIITAAVFVVLASIIFYLLFTFFMQ